MTRGIQLKQLSATDLGHLGIPAHLLANPAAFADALADEPREARFEADGTDLRALTREVRAGLEEALALLVAALPADRRPARDAAASPRHPLQHPPQRAD